jgi:Arc/MetJ-type ribon-helix-helix transcriptional regulator
MPYAFPPDVKRLVETRMASGNYASEDELLRDALEALSAESEELEAIQAAVSEWQAGDTGLPLADAFDEIRRQSETASEMTFRVVIQRLARQDVSAAPLASPRPPGYDRDS